MAGMRTEFQITSDEATLKLLLKMIPSIKVVERWDAGNWNVLVSDADVRAFEEWCEDHRVEAEIL
jgi:hypothetical protein